MIISAKNFSKSFDGGKTFALENVNLDIAEGEFIAIIGLSGAGKTTFLRAINGTNSPGNGTLTVLGKEVSTLDDKNLGILRKQIGFIFQQFNLVKNLSVIQNVLLGRIAHTSLWRSLTGFFSPSDMTIAKLALDSVGLPGRYHEKVRNLSGGQQQRIAIARTLVQHPKIILADEPMASLDPRLSEVVIQILAKANQEQKITVLINIHILEIAKKYAGRIIAFRKGKLFFDGPASALTPNILEEIYRVDAISLEQL